MPTPRKNEKRGDFVSRCIPVFKRDHPGSKTDQAVVVCGKMFDKFQRTGRTKKGTR